HVHLNTKQKKRLLTLLCFYSVFLHEFTSVPEYDGFTSGFMEFYQKTVSIMKRKQSSCYRLPSLNLSDDGIAGSPGVAVSRHTVRYHDVLLRWYNTLDPLPDANTPHVKQVCKLSTLYAIQYSSPRCKNDVSCHPRQQYCTLGLFWPGSLCANMIVFVPRIVVGKYGSEICPAFWLNMPFLLVPIWGTVFLFSRPRDMPLVGASKAVCEQKKALIWSPLDLLFVVYLVAAMRSTIFKGL
ncbi:hypothetical protein cypCar_00025855, partial [Cyprinus carpio]